MIDIDVGDVVKYNMRFGIVYKRKDDYCWLLHPQFGNKSPPIKLNDLDFVMSGTELNKLIEVYNSFNS